MKCENYLCIYENRGKCRLKSITLDILGQCTKCVYVTFSEEELKQAKKQALSTEKN